MGRVVVITGASSGIGAGLKSKFEKNGDLVVNLSKGLEIEDDKNIKLDVSDKSSVELAFEKIYKNFEKIDVLINCAGYGVFGATELLTEEKCRQIFDVNFFGTLWCCQAALKYMKRGARIINISSACAIFALPFRTLYCASKSAVSMLSNGLRMELCDFGIDVTAICPGDVKTNFSKNRDITLDTNNKYGERIEKSCKQIYDRENKRMPQEYAVGKIFKICCKRSLKPMYIIGRSYKFFNLGKKLTTENFIYTVINKKF